MDLVIYILARWIIAGLQVLPLPCVARVGRLAGAVAYLLDVRHRRVALQNLQRCFGRDKSAKEIRALARENFRRIGENFASAIKMASMPSAELERYCECAGVSKILEPKTQRGCASRIVAIGHFGNFELYARLAAGLPGFQPATTYRGLRQPSLNRLMQSLRERSGCRFFERRTEAEALKHAIKSGRLLLGLLADQNGGRRGVRMPFLGHECSTTAAPALLALRYDCPLFTAICFRTGLGRWRIEVGDEIPTKEGGRMRSIEAITADVNRAFEAAVRRDPANWFWVHNRWKSASPRTHKRRHRGGPRTALEGRRPSAGPAANSQTPVAKA